MTDERLKEIAEEMARMAVRKGVAATIVINLRADSEGCITGAVAANGNGLRVSADAIFEIIDTHFGNVGAKEKRGRMN